MLYRGAEPRGLWEMAPRSFVLFFEKIIMSRVVEDDSKEKKNECRGQLAGMMSATSRGTFWSAGGGPVFGHQWLTVVGTQ